MIWQKEIKEVSRMGTLQPKSFILLTNWIFIVDIHDIGMGTLN